MFHIVLYEPEIPPNTGNIIRLCANTGCHLHLVHPLGFNLSNAKLRRAGLDYQSLSHVDEHADWPALLAALSTQRLFACSTRGRISYHESHYQQNDVFVFGPETRGLPDCILDQFPMQRRLRIPMQPGNRSLNLANAATVIVYEAWRQLGFAGK